MGVCGSLYVPHKDGDAVVLTHKIATNFGVVCLLPLYVVM